MTINANGKLDTGLQEANGHLQNVSARDEVGHFGVGTSNFRGDWSRITRTEDVKVGCEEAMQVQQQRSEGSVVNWETLLHIRSIKVLLVENDDSTRHVVAALLRNLNYEVIVAANGMQAWRILEDLTNHIDIVLTEVVMPCLSGIGLLCKIMSHKTRKSIPVIMTSSHDSMGLVFKCLSKGAVDFLGKPIRKNELKNLWQHVWRRCHSSSGSGSESGTYTQKSVKSKSGLKSEKNSSSKNEDDTMSSDLKTDRIDEDSDSQSSWTKEVDSSQAMSSRDQIAAKSSDSTCAQLCSNAETCTKAMVPVSTSKEYQENGERIDNARDGKDFGIENSKTVELQLENANEVPFKLSNTKKITHSKLEPYPNKTRRINDPTNYSKHPFNKDKAIVANLPSPQEASEDHAKTCKSKNALDNSKGQPETELNLKRLRVAKDTGKAIQTDRNVLRRSDLSTFSRFKWYNTTSNGFKTPNGINVSGSLETVKDESDIRPCSNGNLMCPTSDGVNNNVDMGSITDKLYNSPAIILKDKVDTTSSKLEATSAINDLNLSSVFAPREMDLNSPLQQVILVKTDDLASPALLTPIRGSPRELPVQHIHHHHHVHHFHSMDREQPVSNLEELSYEKLTEESPHLSSLNVFVGPVEGNTGNCSLNKSGSGSKHGSNGQNGSSTIVHAEGTNVESDVYIAGKSASGDASGSGSGKRINQNRSAHREVSLTKIRQKERRFGNKARYQNKKRLAD